MRPWVVHSLLFVASIAFALVCSEVVLRLVGFSYPSFFMADSITGHWHRPMAKGWYREEGEAYVQINSAGLRDHEHVKEKPADVFRIAILGDSYAEGFQVDIAKTFWSVLQETLNACPGLGGRRVEAINFGVSGFSTAQELLTLRSRVWDYSPDVVLLAFLTGNDLRDNSRDLAGSYPRPYFELQGNSLVLDKSFTESSTYRLKSHPIWQFVQSLSDNLRVLQLVNLSLNRGNQALTASRNREVAGSEGSKSASIDDQVYYSTLSKEWQKAWMVTERLLEEIQREVALNKSRLLVVTLTSGIQVHPDPKVRQRYMERFGISNLLYPDEKVSQIGKSKEIAVWMLAPVFQEFAEKKGIFLHGFPDQQLGGGHWNEHGHRLAGEYIANRYCREIGKHSSIKLKATHKRGP